MARKMKGGSKKGCGCGPNCKCGKRQAPNLWVRCLSLKPCVRDTDG